MLAPSQPSRSGPPRLPLLGAAHSSWCSLHLPPPSAGCCTLTLVLPPSPTSLCWVLHTHPGAPSISHLPLLGAEYSSWCSLHLPPPSAGCCILILVLPPSPTSSACRPCCDGPRFWWLLPVFGQTLPLLPLLQLLLLPTLFGPLRWLTLFHCQVQPRTV